MAVLGRAQPFKPKLNVRPLRVGSLGTLAITAPAAYRIYQRSGVGTATIAASGTFTGDASGGIEVDWNSNGFTAATVNSGAHTWSVSLTAMPQGQGTLTVRFVADHSVSATSAFVGIGDVFLVIGQSNAEGRLTNVQTSTLPSGLRSVVFKQSSLAWVPCDDPTDVSTVGGSYWPLLGDLLEENLSIPIGFITCADGSTGLYLAGWTKNNAEYAQTIVNVSNSAINAIKACIWYQGEFDSDAAVSRANYGAAEIAMINNFATDLPGSPKTLVFQIGYTGAGVDAIRLAKVDSWDAGGNVLGCTGIYDKSNATHPSSGGNPDSPLGLTIVRRMWASLKANFYSGANSARGPKYSTITYNVSQTDIHVVFNQVLKTGLTHDTSLWAVTGNGVPVTISAITYSADVHAVTLHTLTVPALPIVVSFGLGGSTAGKVAPLGPDIATPDASTINLPAEPFSSVTATAEAGGATGGGGSIIGSSVIVSAPAMG